MEWLLGIPRQLDMAVNGSVTMQLLSLLNDSSKKETFVAKFYTLHRGKIQGLSRKTVSGRLAENRNVCFYSPLDDC